MKIHIHTYKTVDLFFEQSTEYNDVYCDYIIKRCRCGKQKRIFTSIYYADKIRQYLGRGLSYMGLGNKKSLI